MKKLKPLLTFAFIASAFIACEKEEEKPAVPDSMTNPLIGTWRYEPQDPADYYWYQYKFNEDLTGLRSDADKEEVYFNYTYTKTEINFDESGTSPKYSIIDNNKLVIFGDTLSKQ